MANSNINPDIPPRPDISYVGVMNPPPTPERSHSFSGHSSLGPHCHTPSRRVPPPIPPHPEGEWEAREEMKTRELEEARTRVAQMEKTMRWWSDCTANWRQKWSKVRNERNKTREECRQLRAKLEVSVKENTSIKREREDLLLEQKTLRKQLEIYQSNEKDRASICSSGSHKSGGSEAGSSAHAPDSTKGLQKALKALNHSDEDFVSKLLAKKEGSESGCSSQSSEKTDKKKSSEKTPDACTGDETLVQQKIAMVTMKLEEAQKTIQVERDEKTELTKDIESAKAEVSALKTTCDELKQSKQESVEQLSRLQEEHEEQLDRIASELEDESQTRSSMDKQLAHLRKELEKLQAENAQEWGKRERIETEKLALERENKKLKTEIENIQEELERKSRQTTVMLDTDMKALQIELTEKNKEVGDLKHAHSKLRKALHEKTAELEHTTSRAEQYEADVRKLRTRIEELKQELAAAEDEVDQQINQGRKMQRTNDELQVQVDSMQVQLEHLQSRLRHPNQPYVAPRSSSHPGYDVPDSTMLSEDDLEE